MTIKTNFLRLIFFLPVNQAKKIKRIWLKDKKHTEEKNIWQKVWREEEHAKMKLRENWISQYSKYLPASRELPIWSSTSLNRRLFVEIIKHMFCRLTLGIPSCRKKYFQSTQRSLKNYNLALSFVLGSIRIYLLYQTVPYSRSRFTQNIAQIFLESVEIQIQGCWVRSKNATSVLGLTRPRLPSQ